MEQKLQLVTFEQAKRLKELGFDWATEYEYYPPRKGRNSLFFNFMGRINKESSDVISAPSISLAIKWFRDVKNYRSYIILDLNCHKKWKYVTEIDIERRCWEIKYETYEEAESALLDKLLTLS